MPQITKKLNGNIGGISISIDSGAVHTSVMWTEVMETPGGFPNPPASGRTSFVPVRPLGISPVSISGGKVRVGQTVIGDAPPAIAAHASTLALAVKMLVDSLVATGKISL